MRNRTTNRVSNTHSGRRGNDALRFAVQLALSQLSNGIGIAEAVQFAAKYHNVTCAAIEAELSKKGNGMSSAGLSGL
jgi:hypothetical protein